MLTQDQINFFHHNGYLIMRSVVNGPELQRLRAAVDAVQADGVARQGADHLYSKMPDGKEVYWRSENIWNRDDIFKAVTVHPDILENIGQCVGQAFFPWNDSLVVKLANSGAPVPWHQDPPYGDIERKSVYPVPNFTTDIYMDHSGPDNGCVWAIPGRHLMGRIDLSEFGNADDFRQLGAVPIEMEAGDILFHCLSTPHGSKPNYSNRQRRIFYIHYIADEVLRDAYGQGDYHTWSASKPGWGKVRKAMIDRMLAARTEMGWEDPLTRSTLRFGDGGFQFTGTPITPSRHWGELQKKR